jgi:hypothetical protein
MILLVYRVLDPPPPLPHFQILYNPYVSQTLSSYILALKVSKSEDGR